MVEVLVYFAVLAVLLNVAYVAFGRALGRSEALRRSAEDIARALRAGERWRADVRAATGTIRVERSGEGERVWIPGPRGGIAYERMTNALMRREGDAPAVLLLARVKASAMTFETRGDVTVWRWELELQPPTKRPASMRPLFTFLAVPERSRAP
jgi:Tfp pilus assembly protein FimT